MMIQFSTLLLPDSLFQSTLSFSVTFGSIHIVVTIKNSGSIAPVVTIAKVVLEIIITSFPHKVYSYDIFYKRVFITQLAYAASCVMYHHFVSKGILLIFNLKLLFCITFKDS